MARVFTSTTVIELSPWLTIHIAPSGAWARVRGWRPTAISAILVSRTASITVTLLLSGLTFQTCVPELSRIIVDEFCGRASVGGTNTVACTLHEVVPKLLFNVARTL